MKTRNTVACIALTVALALFCVLPVYAGVDEGTSSGTATVGNATPTVTSPGLWDVAATDKNNSALTVQTEYWANCTVGDNNQLYDIVNVTFYIFEDNAANWDSADANETHYTIYYDNATDAWVEAGPDAGEGHVVAANCSDPADHSATSGTYKVAFKLEKTANYTGATSWWINITVFDGSGATANVQTLTFSLNAYYEITVVDTAHAWAGLVAGTENNTLTTPADTNIDVTCITNNDFKLQGKGSGDLTNGTNVIGLGNITIHEDTLASSAVLTDGYLDIGGLTSETRGWAVAKSFMLWIDVPAGTPAGAYTYTLSVKVLGA